MSGRSRSYNKMIAQKMCDPNYASGKVLHYLESGHSISEALRLSIISMGIKEFAHKSSIPLQNVSEFVRAERNFGYRRLSKSLSVFGLEFTVRKTTKAA